MQDDSNNLPQNASEYETIAVFIFLLLITVITILTLIKTYQYRRSYPISVLSPKLTLLQGVSLYVFILDCTLILWRWRAGLINKDTPNQITLWIDSFAFIYFRGLFLVVTSTKSYRYIIATRKKELQRSSLIVNILSNEIQLCIISCLITLFFYQPIFFGYAYWRDDNINNILFIFEETSIVKNIVNFIEHFVIITIGFLMRKNIQKIVVLKNYILKPFIVYYTWYIFNSLVSNLSTDADDGNGQITLMMCFLWCSCMVRAMVLFTIYIIIPLQSDGIYRPFEPVEIATDFEYFFYQDINLTSFVAYLYHLDETKSYQSYLEPELQSSKLRGQLKTGQKTAQGLFDQWLELRIFKAETNQASKSMTESIEAYIKQLPINQSSGHHSLQMELYEEITDIMKMFYESYHSTNSFQTLYEYHSNFNTINQNLYTLRMQEFVPI